jgi:putative modified peptide
MSTPQRKPNVALRMTPGQARNFVELLETDDKFRAALAARPRKVLADYGVEIAPSLIPASVKLPDKRQVARIRSAIDGKGDIRIPANGVRMWPGILLVFAIAKRK